jgi:hypothetical protein
MKAHRLVYHSTQGWRVIKKEKDLLDSALGVLRRRAHLPRRQLHQLREGVGLQVLGGAFSCK